MDVGGFDYNEPVTNMNVLTAVQAIVNHVKNTMDMNNKIDTVRSDLVILAGRLDLSFTLVNKTVNDVKEKGEKAVKDLNMMKDQIDMWKATDIGPSIEELKRNVKILEGFSIKTEQGQSAVNEAIKYEMSRSNVVTDEVIKYIKSLTEPGGELLKTIEHLTSLGSAASDVRINSGMNEIANVKARVLAIEKS